MSFWEEVRAKVLEHTTSSDLTASLYKKIASTGANEMAMVKPTYYLGQVSVLAMDYMDFVEKFLKAKEKDFGEYLKMILYIRESAKSIGSNIKEVSEPLETLIQDMEELFEGEGFEEEEAEEEAEEIDEEDLKEISEEEEETEIKADLEATREDLESEKEKLNENLKVRLRDAGISDTVAKNLADTMSEIYMECVQYARELGRLTSAGDGDLASILSVMIDLQYGLDVRLRDLILEDLYVDNERNYAPGVITWISHFTNEIMERINAEEVMALTV